MEVLWALSEVLTWLILFWMSSNSLLKFPNLVEPPSSSTIVLSLACLAFRTASP